ncbi:Dimer-Tnp-hAT domain containing protein [Pyrenophora tritici-repentis]|nr:Dimer-Tnp-hAT domain containing protein [Pyrenophora tritici-repentis]PZD22731.1 Dimer-Tnp-hAT domain containing protein [Pyrenophora tritici-repentis]
MPPRATKKRTRATDVPTASTKRLRILAAPPPTPEPSQSWERQQLESQPQETINAPTEGSHAGTRSVATTEVAEDSYIENGGDDFDGLDWDRLGKRYIKPLSQPRRAKSWIYQYGYRVVHRDTPTRQFWPAKCHNLNRMGVKATPSKRSSGQLSLREVLAGGFEVPQATANAMGNFDIQRFRYAVVLWLLDNNLLMELISRASTRDLFRIANGEAESALWRSPRSVATYAMRLFHLMQPQIVHALSSAISKIHIIFDGWTTKGGTRGFFGIVAHFATSSSKINDLPIALPPLTGAHTGEAIATAVTATLRAYGITSDTLGYFVLDNASNNDTAIAAVAREFGNFEATERRLRCGPHTINLIGQALLFGKDKDAYNNATEQVLEEEMFMQQWRKNGALGTLLAVITYIKTPQQYQLFADCLLASNNDLPAAARVKMLRPIKPVVTRWNSYYNALERATYLKGGFDLYIEKYISRIAYEDRRGTRNDVPAWMRSGGLEAADWAVITEYQRCLQPLKMSTGRLEGRGKYYGSNFGAIHEVIPVFEYLLDQLEKLSEPYKDVVFDAHAEAPEGKLYTYLCYYHKLDDSAVYYTATCLHPYYKYYCENSWEHKPSWLRKANEGFQKLWESYKLAPPRSPPRQPPRSGAIDDVIGALTSRRNCARSDSRDEYDRWRELEPEWSMETYHGDGNAVQYWIAMKPKYPQLSEFAIDILTIPASSCECERLFSELGDLLEPKRRAIGSELLAAFQLIRAWTRAGYDARRHGDGEINDGEINDEELAREYNIQSWVEDD